jgi:hypothetical protein
LNTFVNFCFCVINKFKDQPKNTLTLRLIYCLVSWYLIMETRDAFEKSRAGWQLRNIHFWNGNGSQYSSYVAFPLSCITENFYQTWLFEKLRDCLIRNRRCLPFARTWVHSVFFVGFVLPIVLDFCFVLSSFCVLCPMLPFSLDCSFLIPLQFSITFICKLVQDWSSRLILTR